MAVNDSREWIVAYDIADPKRLGRVHRYMVKRAIPMQKSVFHVTMSTVQLLKLRQGLSALIDPKEDDIRIYPLPAQTEIVRLGRMDIAASGVFLA